MPGGPNEQQEQQQQQPQPQPGPQSQPDPNPQPGQPLNPQSQPDPNPQPGQQPQPDPQDALLPEEDDLPDEGPLNIDQMISEAEKERKQGPPRSGNQKRTEAKFKADPRSFTEIATGVEFALDADGVRYDGREAIAKQLQKKGSRLFLFNAYGDPPIAAENRSGKLYVSDDGISSTHQLPGNFFPPAGSLESRSIVGGATPEKIKKANADYVKAKRAYDEGADTYRKEKEKFEEQLKELEKEKPKRKVKKPVKPEFSLGNKIGRWAFKFITLGFGETNAYKKYQADLARYDSKMLDYKADDEQFKEQLKAYNAKENKLIEKIADAETELKELHQPVERTEEYLKRLTGENPNAAKDIRKIKDYRDNLEVKLEGAANLVEEGKITRNNIFAHTWMMKAACEGKDPSDPDAMDALEKYVAAKMVEDKIMLHEMSRQQNPEDLTLLDSLNSGKATEQLRSDPVWIDLANELKNDFEGELIDPEEVYKQLQQNLAQKAKDDKSPLKRLQDAKKSLVEGFGRKPVSEACADDIMRLNVLNRAIKKAKDDSNFSDKTAQTVLFEMHVTSGKTKVVDIKHHRDESLRDAVKTTAAQQGDKLLDLEEMTKLVNENRKAPQKEEDINLKNPGA